MSELKSLPFPVISPDSMDYTDAKYEVKINRIRDENKSEVRHRLSDDNMVAHLLKEGKAAFACVVCLPSTMYRKIFVAPAVNVLEYPQTVDYSASGYGSKVFSLESPMYHPVIVTKEKVKRTADPGDGLNSLWAHGGILIPHGGIIAYGNWARFDGDMGGLLNINLDKDIPDGSFRVEPDTSGGYRFQIYVGGADLFRRLRNPSAEDSEHRRSVLTHVLGGGFRLLKELFGGTDDWKEYTNLRLLSNKLESEGLAHWGDDDFPPEYAATVLYPHVLRYEIEDSEDD